MLNKEEFNNLELKEQKDYLNSKLSKGYSLSKLEKEIGVSRKTYRDRMLKINYRYDKKTNQFLESNSLDKPIENKLQKTHNISNSNNSLGEIFTDVDLKNNLLDIAMNYNKIKDIIDYFNRIDLQRHNDNVIEPCLRDRLLNEKDKNTRTTIRINQDILNDFDKYAEENKEYLKQDLFSAAIYEFLEKRNFYTNNEI